MAEFQEIGWRVEKSQPERMAFYDLDDRVIGIIPQFSFLSAFRSDPDEYVLALNEDISTIRFTRVYNYIRGKSRIKNTFQPMYYDRNGTRIKQPAFRKEDIKDISKALLNWASKVDLNVLLDKFRESGINSKGSLPVCHLAALSLLGKIDILEEYKIAFEKGDRLGAVPYISIEFIDRAISFAKETSVEI